MDDGLQHHTLHRDLSLLVLDALQPLGNGRVLPAGPLREPFARTLGRSDAVCAVAPYADGTGARVAAPPSEAALRDVLGLPQHQQAEIACLGAPQLATPVSPGAGTAGSGWRSTLRRSGRTAQSPMRGCGMGSSLGQSRRSSLRRSTPGQGAAGYAGLLRRGDARRQAGVQCTCCACAVHVLCMCCASGAHVACMWGVTLVYRYR